MDAIPSITSPPLTLWEKQIPLAVERINAFAELEFNVKDFFSTEGVLKLARDYIFHQKTKRNKLLKLRFDKEYNIVRIIRRKYQISGSFKHVRPIVLIWDSKAWAIAQIINRQSTDKNQAMIQKEFEFLKLLQCDQGYTPLYVIALRTEKKFTLYQELIPLGNLQTYTAAKKLDELSKNSIGETLLEGVAYIHSKGVIHADLKMANILLKLTERGVFAVIADFGLSYKTTEKVPLRGTITHMAPEVLRHVNGVPDPFAVDIFGIGLLFLQISLELPELPWEDSEQLSPDQIESYLSRRISLINELCLKQDGVWKRITWTCLNENPFIRPSAQVALEFFRKLRDQKLRAQDSAAGSPSDCVVGQ